MNSNPCRNSERAWISTPSCWQPRQGAIRQQPLIQQTEGKLHHIGPEARRQFCRIVGRHRPKCRSCGRRLRTSVAASAAPQASPSAPCRSDAACTSRVSAFKRCRRLPRARNHGIQPVLQTDGLGDDAEGRSIESRQHRFRLAIIGGGVEQAVCRPWRPGPEWRRLRPAALGRAYWKRHRPGRTAPCPIPVSQASRSSPLHHFGDGQRGGQAGTFDAEQIDQARQAMCCRSIDAEIRVGILRARRPWAARRNNPASAYLA